MKLSIGALIVAGALCNALCFLCVALLNYILRPYGGAYLALLISLYPGYDPLSGPFGIILGVFYSLLFGALAGLLFGWLYNAFSEKL